MHHANILVGTKDWARTHIPFDCESASPDHTYQTFERMSIADVRALVEEATRMPTEDTVRSFVLAVDDILVEAQNALLKLIEEPKDSTVFYFIVPYEDLLIPTLRSRCTVLAREHVAVDTAPFKQFLKQSYTERLDTITKKVKDDTVWTQSIFAGLAQHAHEKKDAGLMREALAFEQYATLSGASKKMLLEHLALSLA